MPDQLIHIVLDLTQEQFQALDMAIGNMPFRVALPLANAINAQLAQAQASVPVAEPVPSEEKLLPKRRSAN